MIWTKAYDSSQGSVNDQWMRYYNGTTLMKNRFTASTSDGVIFTSTLHTLRWKVGSSGYGVTDSIASAAFSNNNETVYGAEMLGADGSEIYAFKDESGHYLVNVYAANDNNTVFWAHSGKTSNNTNACYVNKTSTGISVIDFTTAASTLNNAYGTDYIVQPLYASDEKTPFYVISGNIELPAFTVIQVQTKKFMCIGNGLCVEINV